MEAAATEMAEAVSRRIETLVAAGAIASLYHDRSPGRTTSDDAREVAEIKRFLERWTGDGEFREVVARDANGAARSLGLSIDAAALSALWEPDRLEGKRADELPLALLRYRVWIGEKLAAREARRRPDESLDPRYAAWRQRQLRRAETHLGPKRNDAIVHAPYCIELSQGCSVGCWFCGVAAPRLGDHFLHTPEHRALFGAVLEANRELFGAATGHGFLYWATDPLDNPDYEKFLLDFHEATGVLPQTTTALALKDVERTRALLRLARDKSGRCDRFSLLTRKQLLQVFEAFTPLELLYVELVLQNKENVSGKVRAGRADARAPKRSDPEHVGNSLHGGTIACVSGFLINLVNRTIKLISPCKADERWPLGYIVYAEHTFRDAAEYRARVQQIAEEQMTPALRADDPVAFHDHLDYEPNAGGFALSHEDRELAFADNPVVALVGERLARARHGAPLTVGSLVDELTAGDAEVELCDVLYALELLHARGVLDTMPRLAPPPALVALRR